MIKPKHLMFVPWNVHMHPGNVYLQVDILIALRNVQVTLYPVRAASEGNNLDQI